MVSPYVVLVDSFWFGIGFTAGAGLLLLLPVGATVLLVWLRAGWRSFLHDIGWKVVDATYPDPGQRRSDDGDDPRRQDD